MSAQPLCPGWPDDPDTVAEAYAEPVDLYLKRGVFLTSFATGVPADTAALLYAAQRPLTFSAGNQPSGTPAWKTIPSWYLLGAQDKIITPAQQQMMATRAGAHTVRVRAGHLSLVSHPREVTDLIITAARAVA